MLETQHDFDKNADQSETAGSQKEWAEILNLTHDAIIVHDQDGTIKYWNRGAKEIYGFTEEEAVGHNMHRLLKTEFPKPYQEIEREVADTARWEGQLIQFARDKRRVVVASRWTFKGAVNGTPASMLVTNNEISVQGQADGLLLVAEQQADVLLSEAKQRADVLRVAAQQQAQLVLSAAQQSRTEQRTKTAKSDLERLFAQKEQAELLDLTHDAVIVRDLGGVILDWNRGAEELYGYTKAEAIGRTANELLNSEFPKPFNEIELDLVNNNRWEGELIQFTHDNRRVVVASRWITKADTEGRPRSVLEINSNITVQKQANEVLIAAQQTAQQVLATAQAQAADLLVRAAEKQSSVLLLAQQQQADGAVRAAQQNSFDQRVDASELERLFAQKEQAEILDLTHDAVIVRELDGTIRYWNRGAEETYGYSSKEASGRLLNELLQSQFPKPLEEIEKELTETGRWDGEVIRETQDKRMVVIAVRWVLKATLPDRPCSILEISSDITIQRHADDLLLVAQQEADEVLSSAVKQAQKVLLAAQQTRSDERLRLVVDAAPNAIIMVDQTGTIELVNSQVEYLFGYGREELIGRPIQLLAPGSNKGKSAKSLKEQIGSMTSGQWSSLGLISEKPPTVSGSFFVNPTTKEMAKADSWGKRKDGTLVAVEVGLNTLSIGNETFILASIVDISERNRMAQIMREKIGELASSNEELEQFAYVCSHDLQEPLRVVSNYTRLLAKRYQGKLDGKADQFIGFIVDASSRMQTLINDLLVFSRLKSKAEVLSPTNCLAIVRMAVSNLKVAIEESTATINYESLPIVSGDSSQLLQLFQNLVGNAIKFRRPGGSPVINIAAERDGDFWLFTVQDNGIGIDMEYADRIFVIFQRLNLKEEYVGSGIGLTVCKTVVQRHGGRIWVKSIPDQGTTFYFTIPVIPETIAAETIAAETVTENEGG